MLAWYHIVLLAVILLTLILSVGYSFRHRRQQNPSLKGLYAARMNISMGLLLLALAILQLALFDMSTGRLVLGTAFALLGLFNLFAGIKNHSYFRSLKSPRENSI